MRGILRKPGFRGTAASMPIRHDTFTGTLRWAGVLAVVAMGLLLGGCPQPEGGGGGTTYTVTFEANGGTLAPEAQTVAGDGKVTEPAVMAREGFTFGGWYKEPALATPWDFAADVVTGNISLYAKWIPTYTVTFEANGGTPVPAAQTVAEGGKAAAPSAMTKENNAFGGWFREPAFSTRWVFGTDTVTGDITLYGKWEPLSGGNKAVTWELNGGGWSGGGMPENQVTNGGKIRRPDDPVKDGFTFGGWYKEPGLNGQWVFGTDTVTADITLYAKWEPVRTVVVIRTVTFDAKGGTLAPKAQTVAQGGKVTEPDPMIKGRLTFGGWFRESGLINEWNFAADPVTTNITLYAKWTATVTFVANGGTPVPDQTVIEGDGVPEPQGITKENHRLDGWWDQGLNTQWDFDLGTVTENITLYARWTYDPDLVESQKMVLLSGGTITGDAVYGDLFHDRRTVTLSAFSIAKYETTYELWSEVYQWATNGQGYTFANAGREGYNGSGSNQPVTEISWRDAVVWCNAYSEKSNKDPVYRNGTGVVLKDSTATVESLIDLDNMAGKDGYRLPTEAEWEYAARGGGTPPFAESFAYKWAGTDTEGSLGTYAWYYGNSGSSTHPVGGKAPNSAQLYDMSGNVWEWCWDWYSSSVGTGPEPEPDPVGPGTGPGRVNRGGSWGDDASACAVAYRSDNNPGDGDNYFGFRVAVRP